MKEEPERQIMQGQRAKAATRATSGRLTARQARRLFLRTLHVPRWAHYALAVAGSAVGWLFGDIAGLGIGLLTAAVVDYGVPWIGGRVIHGRGQARLPAFQARGEGRVRDPESSE